MMDAEELFFSITTNQICYRVQGIMGGAVIIYLFFEKNRVQSSAI